MPELANKTSGFIIELDAAVEAHLAWMRRVLRCAVLGVAPGDDLLNPLAHTLCNFGCWLALYKPDLEQLDATKAQRLDAVHQNMHAAIRAICIDLLGGRGGESADMDAFEQTQSELFKLLAEFKTLFLANTARHDPLTGLPQH